MKVSVIFASPSTFNAGMRIVDKAWEIFIKRNKLNLSYKKYRFDSICFDGGSDSGFECLTKKYEEMLSADRIIYWGDFLHMSHYHVRKANQLYDAGLFESYNLALEFVQKVLLLKNEDIDIQNKAISFGTNQMLDGTIENLKEPYNTDLKTLIKNSKAWLPRDLYTANLASIIRNANDFTQGVDCAILAWSNLFEKEVNFNKTTISGSGKIGCFFGRSTSRYLKLSIFSKKMAKKNNSKLIWIPWINREGRSNKMKEKLYQFRVDDTKSGNELDFNDIQWIKTFDFIITDTYHFAVNCWASGTPAICVADTISMGRSSGGNFAWNDKRHMFFQMGDALDFFVHARELDSFKTLNNRINHLFMCLENKVLLHRIINKISNQAKLSEFHLIKAINEK